MKDIDNMCKILPIVYDDKTLKLLSLRYMDEYIDILVSDEYNSFKDESFKTDIRLDKVQQKIYNIILSFRFKIPNPEAARLILLDKHENIIGCCSVLENENVLDIAYFIKPEYRHRNEGYTMVKNLINNLKLSALQFDKFRLTIQEINTKSINLAKRIGFNEVNRIKGRYYTNLIMELGR